MFTRAVLGSWQITGTAVYPATPTGFTGTDDENGDSISFEAYVGETAETLRVWYKPEDNSEWEDYVDVAPPSPPSLLRQGQITGLRCGQRYLLMAMAYYEGFNSIPTMPIFVWCTEGLRVRQEIRSAIAARLLTSSELLSDLGGEHIYYIRPPKGAVYPCVTYFVVDDDPNIRWDTYGYIDLLVQMDAWAEGGEAATALDGIVDILDNLFTQWRLDSTHWKGLNMWRTGGRIAFRAEEEKEQRPLSWVVRVVRKDL